MTKHKLTPTQQSMIRNTVHGELDIVDGRDRRTATSLVKRGLMEKWPGRDRRFVLTEKGEALQRELWACPSCGAETHPFEAACIGCGALKPWALEPES